VHLHYSTVLCVVTNTLVLRGVQYVVVCFIAMMQPRVNILFFLSRTSHGVLCISTVVQYCTVLYCSCLVSLQPKIDTVNERDISEYCVLPVYSPVYRYNDNHNNNSSILFVHSLHSFDALYCTRIYTVSYSFSYSFSYSYSYSFSFGSVSVVT
jgi:hypothetical protein